MNPIQIKPNIYWVGAIDWNIRHFHGHTFTTLRGSTYNAYLIMDEKITLVDTVQDYLSQEMLNRIQAITPLESINYVIINHLEYDHTSTLPQILNRMPKARVFGSPRCVEDINKIYPRAWQVNPVKSGDNLPLGQKTLKFLEAPMVHWPESMFTYCETDKLLLPNDAFGQNFATNKRFDDEVSQCELMEEAAKYYAIILWPYGPAIQHALAGIKNSGWDIDMIAPSHGVIWRQNIGQIMDKYQVWSQNQTKPKAVIIYETMWGSTEKMARQILQALTDMGIETLFFDINQTDKTQVISAMLEARAFIIGSATYNNGMLANLRGLMQSLKGYKPQNRIGAAFGSYGWGGGAVHEIEEMCKQLQWELVEPGPACKYIPTSEEMEQVYEFGKKIGEKIKN